MLDSNEKIPGVMIEQGMLGTNTASRAITPGNEVEYVHAYTYCPSSFDAVVNLTCRV